MTLEATSEDRNPSRGLLGDEGVSPVIGMILVLAISIVGIAAILYWGLPAIDEMKANVEHRSVQSQFQDLDSTLKELVAGTTEKTAKRWQPTINRGEIVVRNNTEPWLFATDGYQSDAVNGKAYDFGWWGFTDGDNTFTVHNNATFNIPSAQVFGYSVGAGASLTQFNLSGPGDANGVQNASVTNWGANTSISFRAYLMNSATSMGLNGGPFYFKVYNGTQLVAQAWYVNTSRIDYSLHAGVSERSVTENNGAVISSVSGSYTLLNAPSIPPPTNTSGSHRFFARALVLNGSSGFAGNNQFDLLVSLYSTSVLASYDCAATDHSDCVASAKITDFGTLQAPWYAYLSDPNRGYGSLVQKTEYGNTAVKYLEDRQAY